MEIIYEFGGKKYIYKTFVCVGSVSAYLGNSSSSVKNYIEKTIRYLMNCADLDLEKLSKDKSFYEFMKTRHKAKAEYYYKKGKLELL